jgi:hypothetical protein
MPTCRRSNHAPRPPHPRPPRRAATPDARQRHLRLQAPRAPHTRRGQATSARGRLAARLNASRRVNRATVAHLASGRMRAPVECREEFRRSPRRQPATGPRELGFHRSSSARHRIADPRDARSLSGAIAKPASPKAPPSTRTQKPRAASTARCDVPADGPPLARHAAPRCHSTASFSCWRYCSRYSNRALSARWPLLGARRADTRPVKAAAARDESEAGAALEGWPRQ